MIPASKFPIIETGFFRDSKCNHQGVNRDPAGKLDDGMGSILNSIVGKPMDVSSDLVQLERIVADYVSRYGMTEAARGFFNKKQDEKYLFETDSTPIGED